MKAGAAVITPKKNIVSTDMVSLDYRTRAVLVRKVIQISKENNNVISFPDVMRLLKKEKFISRSSPISTLAKNIYKSKESYIEIISKSKISEKIIMKTNQNTSMSMGVGVNPLKEKVKTTPDEEIILSSAPSTPTSISTSFGGGGGGGATPQARNVTTITVIKNSTASGTTNTGSTNTGTTSMTSAGISNTGTTSIEIISTGTLNTGTLSTGTLSTGAININTVGTWVIDSGTDITTIPTTAGSVNTWSIIVSTNSGMVTLWDPLTILNTQNPQLQKLVQYQNTMNGFVADHIMVFMNMPQSPANIDGTSYYMANIANEFAIYNITPIFIFEPFGDNGVQLDLGKIKKGDYIANLNLLFFKLKNERNISWEKLGIIVPYPEINTPAFNRTNFVPTDLPILINSFFDTIKIFYPNIRWGILLDSKSYDIGKTWWQGSYKSFAPYITSINTSHIQTFGIQWFPWVSNDGVSQSYNANEFLPVDLASEAADILSIKNIWFNTGTMKRKYQTNTVNITPEQRALIFTGIINQASLLQTKGYTILINIFAQNKFATSEATDWSYIENASDAVLSAHEGVFKSFLQSSRSKWIKIWLFDD